MIVEGPQGVAGAFFVRAANAEEMAATLESMARNVRYGINNCGGAHFDYSVWPASEGETTPYEVMRTFTTTGQIK